MIKHFLHLAVRNFYKLRAYTVINLAGLTLGLSVALLLFKWMQFEKSYDQFQVNKDRIFRIIDGKASSGDAWIGTPAQLAPILAGSIPEIENFVRLDKSSFVVKANNKIFHEENVLLVDSSFFGVFSFALISGNPSTILKDRESVVMSERTAQKYFGNDNPVGQTIIVDNMNFTISGIAKNVPENSHLHFDILIRFDVIYGLDNCWGCYNYSSYLLVKKNVDRKSLENKINRFTIMDGVDKRTFEFLTLQPLTDIHYEYIRGNYEPVFSNGYILGYSSLILIVLFLSCINYINLNVAIVPLRFKEVGIKKTFGAGSRLLRSQFLVESTLYVMVALLLALILSEISLPWFNMLIDKNLSVTYLDPTLILPILGLALFLGTVIGIYPAIITGNVSVIRVIKGTNLPVRKSGFHNILVFIQLVISIGFIISTFIFNKQLYFIRHKDLGFDKDKILNINLYANGIMSKEDYNYFKEKSNVLKNTLLKYNAVKYASINSFLPSKLNRNHGISFPGQAKEQEMGMFVISGDKDFTTTFNIQILAGEEKIRDFQFNGTFGYILNESALKALGWEDALDKQFSIFGPESPGRIIGVCKDFNYRSLHHKLGPCVIVIGEGGSQISLKIAGSKINETIANVEKKYKEFFTESPFDFYFFDQDFDKMYSSEIKITGTAGAVTVLSLLIAGLGLFGMASFHTVQRTKEIGIRKVFGSSDFNILWIFLKEIFWLVILALIITTPLTILILSNWLKNYAYKTTINWWIFPIVGLITLFLSWLTIIYQTFEATRKNPVDILRWE